MDITPQSIETFLNRPQIDFDHTLLHEEFAGKTLLITGCGGSIGSELVRKLIRYPDLKLVLIERSELNYSRTLRYLRGYSDINFSMELCDISRPERITQIFQKYRPDIVFHSAAYKHVPILEHYPIEAVINNILPTQMIADLCDEYGVSKAVFISTDKAVYPNSILGISKRLGELYFNLKDEEASQRGQSKTQYIPVRFGNVFGSSGSVFTIFSEQITQGGPLTITHPDVDRYFMSLDESISLVLMSVYNRLQTKQNRGATNVLNLGEPVKIQDIAMRMIDSRLFSDRSDISIEYIGLKDGEKMSERLFEDHEILQKTACENLMTSYYAPYTLAELKTLFARLQTLAKDCNQDVIRNELNMAMQFLKGKNSLAA